ncbi:hypothetical protein NGRA_1509 [Nosema granulosis]|uniref:Ricin B lectin n=1 Tax=Nosema granulosis TaxID=83296 RepID=A0A9P6GYC2_9MICR|nr:hypothetical protein NGRA_1509 [Nosema granulosis]
MLTLFLLSVASKLVYISSSIKPCYRISLLEARKSLSIYVSNIHGEGHDQYNDVVSLNGNPTELNFEYNNVCGSKNTTKTKSCLFQKKYFRYTIIQLEDGVKFMTDDRRCLKLGSLINNDLYYLELDVCNKDDRKQIFIITELEVEDEQAEPREEVLPSAQRVNRAFIDNRRSLNKY